MTTDRADAPAAREGAVHPHHTMCGAQSLLARVERSRPEWSLDGHMVDVRLDDLRYVAPVLRAYLAKADPAPAAPAPGVEAMASLDEMADRLRQRIGAETGTFMSLAQARANIAYAFTGLVSDDAALSAVLARLAVTKNPSAAPAGTISDAPERKSSADPAREWLGGAVREAARGVVDQAKNHGSVAFVPWPTLIALDKALAAEGEAGDGWSFDMDAAPRRGEKFDAWCVHPETGGFGCRFPDVQMRGDGSGFGIMLWGPWGSAAWAYLDGRDGLMEPWRIIAWRPLPAPPHAGQGRGGDADVG